MSHDKNEECIRDLRGSLGKERYRRKKEIRGVGGGLGTLRESFEGWLIAE